MTLIRNDCHVESQYSFILNAPKNIRQTFKLGVLAVTHKLCWGDNLTENGRQQNNCKKNNSSKLVGFNQLL